MHEEMMFEDHHRTSSKREKVTFALLVAGGFICMALLGILLQFS